MKKKFLLIIVALALSMSVVLCACGDTEPTGRVTLTDLSEAEETQIKNAFYTSEEKKVSVGSIYITGYYGKYDGAPVITIHCSELAYGGDMVDIADIPKSGMETYYLYKDGKLYSLKESKESGFLTDEDLKIIKEKREELAKNNGRKI